MAYGVYKIVQPKPTMFTTSKVAMKKIIQFFCMTYKNNNIVGAA